MPLKRKKTQKNAKNAVIKKPIVPGFFALCVRRGDSVFLVSSPKKPNGYAIYSTGGDGVTAIPFYNLRKREGRKRREREEREEREYRE